MEFYVTASVAIEANSEQEAKLILEGILEDWEEVVSFELTGE